MKKCFSNLIVLLAVAHIDIFVIALFLSNILNFTISDTAITCFFTFWGVEMLSLAGIRVCKAKYTQTYEENVEELQNN